MAHAPRYNSNVNLEKTEMTKKDFVLLAAVLADCRPIALSEIGKGQLAQHDMTVAKIADALRRQNPRFDRARFILACS